jgi:glyoxylase-like metal-dependent hydrolase (beta-lactamase superfamily II)
MASSPAVRLAANVWRIPTAPAALVNSYAFVEDDGSVTLVDTGVKKAPPRIVAGLAAMGKHPRDVTRIVLTHAHPDHAGGVAEMARRTGAQVQLHDAEHPWAEAGEVLAKPKETTLLGRLLMRVGKPTFEPFTPGPALTDGEVLPVAGGLRVVHTPGHSPGHVSPCAAVAEVAVRGLPADPADRAPPRRARLRRRGVHPRPGDP